MMQEERKGEIYMLLLSLIESWFPILSLFSIPLIGAIYSYTFAIVIATVIFLSLLVYQKKVPELFQKNALKDLLLTTLFINLLFVLIFIGLQYTTAGNMAVIIFLQLLFAYLYFNLFGSDTLSPMHTAGAAVMGLGALTVLVPDDLSFNRGDLIILIAAAIAPFANLYQKRARSYVSSETILAFRNVVALPVIFALAYLFEPVPTQENLIKAAPVPVKIDRAECAPINTPGLIHNRSNATSASLHRQRQHRAPLFQYDLTLHLIRVSQLCIVKTGNTAISSATFSPDQC